MKKFPTFSPLGIGATAVLVLATVGIATQANGLRKPPDSQQAAGTAGGPQGVAKQVHDDVRKAVRKNARAASLEEWRESGFTPAEIFQNIRELDEPEAIQALHDALSALPDRDLALFEDELKSPGPRLSTLETDSLLRRIQSHWSRSRAQLSEQADQIRQQVLGSETASDTQVLNTPTIEREVDLRKDDFSTDKEIRAFFKEKEIVITLDDGPHPTRTARILRSLADRQVRVNFFQVGRMAKLHPELSRKAASEGHIVGSHSMTHPLMSRLPVRKAEEEIRGGRNTVKAAVGDVVTDPTQALLPFFRFPYGASTEPLRKFVREQGMVGFYWNMDSLDWKHRNTTVLFKNVLKELSREKRGIILFHDIQEQTAIVLPHVLDTLNQQGYQTLVLVPHAAPLP